MAATGKGRRPVKAALIVDFDNVAATLGADLPARIGAWLRYIEEGGFAPDGRRRKLVIKRCYWNIHNERHREKFERAGFSVIACLSRTCAPKSSADIILAIDMMDALRGRPKFDEVILLSGDSDFTPLIERAKSDGLRTIVFASGAVVPSYVDSADLCIDKASLAAAINTPRRPREGKRSLWSRLAPWGGEPAARARAAETARFAAAVEADLRERNNMILSRRRMMLLLSEFEAFHANEGDQTSWLGHGGLAPLLREAAKTNPALAFHENGGGAPTLKLVKDDKRQRLRKRPRAFDLDNAAQRVASAARNARSGELRRRGVIRALFGLPGFTTLGPNRWLGHQDYRLMLEGLAARRGDLAVKPVGAKGAVVCIDDGDPEADRALELAFEILARVRLPLTVVDFLQRLLEAGAPGHWRPLGVSAPGFLRLLKRIALGGFEVDRNASQPLIRERARNAPAKSEDSKPGRSQAA